MSNLNSLTGWLVNTHRYVIAFIICISFFNISQKAYGSHAMGTELTYVCLGNNTYEFTMYFYRDCGGISAPTSVIININSNSCGFNGSTTLTATGPGIEISPLCPSALSTCSGGSNPGVEMYEYQGTFTLPQNCSDWVFSFSECCRNGLITNLTSASSQNLYVESTLDNSSGDCNNSPSFTTLPVPYICAQQPVNYNLGAYDTDGDSLVYTLIGAMGGSGAPLVYNPPYSGTYPITTDSGYVNFDPITGNLSLTPNAIQTCIVTVLVEEYRDGILIGSIMRDIQVIVLNCPQNTQPMMASPQIINFSGGGVLLDSNSIEVCVGTPVIFDLIAVDSDSTDTLTLTTNLATVNPSAFFDTSGVNPVTANFSWVPSNADIGLNTFTVTIEDDACPILGKQTYVYDINVLQGVYAGPDIFHCSADSIQLSASGSTNYSWSPSTGLSDSTIHNPMALPTTSTTYIVTGDSTGACQYIDTVTVNIVTNFSLTADPSHVICLYDSVELSTTVSPAGTYTYSWTPTTGLDDPSLPNPKASPLTSTTYQVNVTAPNGCENNESVQVTVSDFPLTVSPTTDTSIICSGDTANLYSNVYASDCSDYFTSSIGFAPIAGSGTSVSLSDDQLSNSLPIGFTFNFFCNDYTNFYISSNGFITFSGGTNNGCCSGQLLPNNLDPNNLIAFAWDDLNPFSGGTIQYFTTGTAPNRKLVVEFNSVPHCCSSLDPVTSQVILCEGTNYIEIHTTDMPNDGSNHTMGIENIDGSFAVPYPGRNSNGSWTASNEGVRFSPKALASYTVAWYENGTNLIGNTEDISVTPDTLTTYTVIATDLTSGCVVSDSLTISASPAISLSLQSQDASCGSADGLAIAVANGGTPPIQFLWSDSTTNDTASGLTAGTYTVWVTDSNGCSSTGLIPVNDAGAATASIASSTDVSCNGGSDGSATVSATGGTVPYTYIWDDNSAQTSATADSLEAGTYSVTVTDNLGCNSSISVTILEPVLLSTFLSKNDALCGLPNGDATVQGIGGTPPYYYLWDDSASQTTATAVNLAPGIYTATVTDGLGCTATGSINVLGINAPVGTISAYSDVTYYGGSDGFATVSATGGNPPYTYLWSDPSSQTTVSAIGLSAGSYTVTITDFDTCLAVVSITIAQPPPIDISVIGIDSLGTSCSETITINVLNYGDTLYAGDSIPLSYDVNMGTSTNEYVVLTADLPPGGMVSYSFTVSANLYSSGSYLINSWATYAGDGNNGNDSTSATVVSSFPLSMNPQADTNVVCYGESTLLHANINSSDCSVYQAKNTAFAPVTGTGTVVSLSDDAVSAALPIGFNFNFYCNDYTDFYISSNGFITFNGASGNGCCSGQTLPDVSDPNNLIAFAWEDLDPGAPGGGTIEYLTKGTAPNRSLVMNFMGVPHYPGPSPNLDVTTQVILYETTNLIEIHTTDMPTDGGSHTMGVENIDGSDAVTFPGRNASGAWSATNEGVQFQPLQIMGYSVEWYDGAGNLIDTVADITVSPTTQTTYTVIVTDLSNGCTIIDSVTIDASPALNATITSQDATCGSMDGEGTVTITGGNPPYSYLWNDPMAQTTATATGLDIGVYDVVYSDANGCSDSGLVSISNVGAPVLGTPTITNVSCFGGSDGTATVAPTGGSTPYNYDWNDAASQTTATATGLPAGTYIVSVSGSDNCTSTAIATITEPTELTASGNASNAGCGSSDGSAWVSAMGGTQPYTYLWDDSLAQTTDTANNLVAGVYNVTVTDGNGCTAQTMATVGNPSAPTATLASSTDASCYGSTDGSAEVIVSGGTPPYNYLWDDPLAQTTATATDLPAGNFVATITDNSGCVVSVSVTIGQPPAIAFPYLETFDSNTPLNSGSPGNPIITLDNGWENAQNDGLDWAPRSSPTNSSNTGPLTDHTSGSGNYIYVEDGFDSDSVNLLSPCINIAELCGPTLSFWYHSYNGSSPADSSSLHLDILYGGTWNLDVISPIGVETDAWQQKIVDLSSFQDAITIRFRVNNNNFTPYHDIAIDDVEIYGLGNMTTSVSGTDASCYGNCDGEATATATNGIAPITYLWDDPSSQTTSTATGLCAGSYVVTVTDSAGCVATETVTISEPAALSATTSVDTATTGNNDGGATVTVTGGASPYTYSWNDPANQTTASATGLAGGTYSCDITDANGCSTQVVVTIPEVTSIWNNNGETAFDLYPNPSTGKVQLRIFIPGEELFEISIQNALGEEVDRFTFRESNGLDRSLDLKHLSNGVYVIQLKTNQFEMNRQLILTD